MEENTRAGARTAAAALPPGTQPSDWRRALDALPASWPRPLKEQAADPVVRAAVRLAYLSGVSVAEISRRTGRSPEALRLMLSREGVLGAAGGNGPRTGLPAGYATWSAYATAAIRRRLDNGTYPPATPLPPYRALAAELDVSPTIACAAVRRLKDEGRLRREGRRLVVAGPAGRPVPHRPATPAPRPVPAGMKANATASPAPPAPTPAGTAQPAPASPQPPSGSPPARPPPGGPSPSPPRATPATAGTTPTRRVPAAARPPT
ncbi:GntR family transcriptional regulator [Streptomyces sp. NPDC004539]|uniref:GntR family transcriptional regulator n=1 Tax=Streptomyces sp. NPDC004539 TaxID=3154280 RepID=UPI0033B73961